MLAELLGEGELVEVVEVVDGHAEGLEVLLVDVRRRAPAVLAAGRWSVLAKGSQQRPVGPKKYDQKSKKRFVVPIIVIRQETLREKNS